MTRFTFFDDAAEFLEAAGPVLEADPLLGTIVATMATREARQRAEGVPRPSDRPYWWAVLHDDAGRPVSCAMRTAPSAPYPPFVLPMPETDARTLAGALHERAEAGEAVDAVNGFRPTVDVVADELAGLAARTAEATVQMRLFEVRELVRPTAAPGRLRLARADEVDLCVDWYDAFAAAADEQAGREPGVLDEGRHDRDEMLGRIRDRRVCLWVDEDDRPVHVTGFNAPAFGVARIGPVYTPPEHRGRGLASNAVAAVSRMLLEDGARVCLYTDQANPVSNRIYQALGYRAVTDQVHYRLQ